MRTLPDSPSLEYLRRQAKDLLLGMRQVRPETSLTEAQTALADQYGFRTWPDLKVEVERRQGGAEITDPGLAQSIATRFGLGTVTAPMRSLPRASEVGRPWALDTDTGRWAVNQLNRWYGIGNLVEHAETDARLQEAALAAGVRLPRPVRSVSGAVVHPSTRRAIGWRWPRAQPRNAWSGRQASNTCYRSSLTCGGSPLASSPRQQSCVTVASGRPTLGLRAMVIWRCLAGSMPGRSLPVGNSPVR
jgi:hypothetical protein